MEKIINGKRYNTKTAVQLGDMTHGGWGNFDSVHEELYRKRTGEFFLAGEGGARTRYASFAADGWSRGGEKIIPLTEEEAREWVERNLDADQYKAIFGEAKE